MGWNNFNIVSETGETAKPAETKETVKSPVVEVRPISPLESVQLQLAAVLASGEKGLPYGKWLHGKGYKEEAAAVGPVLIALPGPKKFDLDNGAVIARPAKKAGEPAMEITVASGEKAVMDMASLGRSASNDLRYTHERTSFFQGVIFTGREGKIHVADKGSTNGTLVLPISEEEARAVEEEWRKNANRTGQGERRVVINEKGGAYTVRGEIKGEKNPFQTERCVSMGNVAAVIRGVGGAARESAAAAAVAQNALEEMLVDIRAGRLSLKEAAAKVNEEVWEAKYRGEIKREEDIGVQLVLARRVTKVDSRGRRQPGVVALRSGNLQAFIHKGDSITPLFSGGAPASQDFRLGANPHQRKIEEGRFFPVSGEDRIVLVSPEAVESLGKEGINKIINNAEGNKIGKKGMAKNLVNLAISGMGEDVAPTTALVM